MRGEARVSLGASYPAPFQPSCGRHGTITLSKDTYVFDADIASPHIPPNTASLMEIVGTLARKEHTRILALNDQPTHHHHY
jgi:hypothetical protein